jgi:ATP-dependent exoDNAse (exonuclease V) beta subunit
LIGYLKNLKNKWLDDIFNKSERCSQLFTIVKIKKEEKYNHACKLADLALKSSRTNKERHSVVEKFMLVNDSSTIACEVPVWFWEKSLNAGICGHIDLLQIRQDKIYILDFKPGASRENDDKVASQLYLYASGLSFRTSIPLKEFRCAWFDDMVYYEFNPAESNIRIKDMMPKS